MLTMQNESKHIVFQNFEDNSRFIIKITCESLWVGDPNRLAKVSNASKTILIART